SGRWWKNPKLWRIGLFGLCGLGLLGLIWQVRSVLMPFYLAFFLAYIFSPAVGFLHRQHLPRGVAIVIVYCGFAAAVTILVVFGLPEVFKETNKFAESLPRYAVEAQTTVEHLNQHYRRGLPPAVLKAIDTNLGAGEAWLSGTLQDVIAWFISLVAALPLLVLAPILSIYLLLDWERLKSGLKQAVPRRVRGNLIHLAQEINFVLRKFIRGHLTVATIVGGLIGVGMQLIGMDYALLIGIISGLFDLIPYFGPIIGAIPAVGLAILKSPAMALRVALVIFVVQQVESNLIHPKIVGESVGLHPFLVVFVLLAGAKLCGFWGMLLAVPVAGVIRVGLSYIYLKLV
ncbi:MAG: AI-2E family transporter, partial [Peptococcaceae bacterium]|nr:AI-2E family transporter [Peptococcaceae bacterium]